MLARLFRRRRRQLRLVCEQLAGLLGSSPTDSTLQLIDWLERWWARAKRLLGLDSVTQAHPGAVTFVQRFVSAVRLRVHPHALALDGVCVRAADGQLVFHPQRHAHDRGARPHAQPSSASAPERACPPAPPLLPKPPNQRRHQQDPPRLIAQR